MKTNPPLMGVILAGGLARRLGGMDKAFVKFQGIPLIQHVVTRLHSQIDTLCINANGNPKRFDSLNIPVIPDHRPGCLGPLAGIEAVFLHESAPWILTVPVDVPFLPLDLVTQLRSLLNSQTGLDRSDPIVIAASQERVHPVVALWPRASLPMISKFLDQGQQRVQDLLTHHPYRVYSFPLNPDGLDPFFNVNKPGDIWS